MGTPYGVLTGKMMPPVAGIRVRTMLLLSKNSVRVVQGRGRGVHLHQATGWILHVQPSKLGELYLLTPILPAFFVVGTHLAILRQELRRAIREVSSPSPQLEDPDRALGPGLEEDPDLSVELINQ